MGDFEELRFVIPAYSPETMPLGRLIEYLQQIATIIGDPNSIHLVDIEKSSTAPVFLVQKRIALEARVISAKVERGEGTREQARAFRRIGTMLHRDARDAGRPAVLKGVDNRILLRIPVAIDDPEVITGVRQATSFDGELIKAGGAGENPSLQMRDLEGNIYSGFTTSKPLAKEMAALLYEPVRVSGVGIWNRSSEGRWTLERMHVQSYEPLEDEDLSLVLEKLRDHKVKWPSNALAKLQAEREGRA